MAGKKQRVTVTVDVETIGAAQEAVAAGRAASLSSWVSDAIEAKVRNDRKLEQLGAAIADYEAEFGEITDEEMVEVAAADAMRSVEAGPDRRSA